jgi:hypothetical protein
VQVYWPQTLIIVHELSSAGYMNVEFLQVPITLQIPRWLYAPHFHFTYICVEVRCEAALCPSDNPKQHFDNCVGVGAVVAQMIA